MNMIDLHTHLLPCIDDGAASFEEATRLIHDLLRQGVEVAVCTPHFDPSQLTLDDFLGKRTAAMELMKASGIRLISGSEISYHDYLFHYTDISQLCIENTKYLLLELPERKQWGKEVFYYIEHLINYYGVIPIIAHIERYRAVRKKKNIIPVLMAAGCMIQLNAAFVVDRKTRRRAFLYLKKGYIDVLASDCHNPIKRPPRISKAYEIIRNGFGNAFCEHLMNNSRKIIDGEIIRGKVHYLF